MAIAHVCMRCGSDLSRIRAPFDATFGVGLVKCPRCDQVSARSRHPHARWWRWFHRSAWAGLHLSVQITATCALTGFAIAGFAYVPWTLENLSDQTAWVMIAGAVIVLPILTGLWLNVCFPHIALWKKLLTWPVWVAFVAMIVGSSALMTDWGWQQRWRLSAQSISLREHIASEVTRKSFDRAAISFVLFFLWQGVITATLAPLGRIIGRFIEHRRRERRAKRRAQLRSSSR